MKKRLVFFSLFLIVILIGSLREGRDFSVKAATEGFKIGDVFNSGAIIEYLGIFDKNSDGTLSEEEIAQIKKMDISGRSMKSFPNLSYFTALEEFKFDNTEITTIDLTKNANLKYVSCNNCSSLNTLKLPSGVERLECSNTGSLVPGTKFTIPTGIKELSWDGYSGRLDLSQYTSLEKVSCLSKNLTGLVLPKTSTLTTVELEGSGLSSIDLTGLSGLSVLNVAGSNISSLNLSNCKALTRLDCSNIPISALDVSGNPNLVFLNCSGNNLTELNTSSNTRLQYLICADNKLTGLDLKSNRGISELYCKGNSIEELDLGSCNSLGYLSCYGNPLTYISLSETAMEKGLNSRKLYVLSDDSEAVAGEGVSLVSGSEEGKYYTPQTVKIVSLSDINVIGMINYKSGGKDIVLKIVCVGFEAGDIRASADCQHIFRDYTHKLPMAETSIRVYGNAVTTKNKDGQKVNRKTAVLYTDIKPSYIYTEKRGKVTAKTGKVVVGLTMTDTKPVVTKKNKIEDAQAANIARASIKSGMITINATGKGSGVVYLWVIDTGSDGECEVCPINVAMAPKKIQAKDKAYNDPSGTVLKNPKFDAGTKLNIFLNPIGGDGMATGDCTYTVELDSKSQSVAELTENTEGEYGYTITSKNAAAKKKSKVTLKVTCDQTGRTFKWYATIVPVKETPVEEKKD